MSPLSCGCYLHSDLVNRTHKSLAVVPLEVGSQEYRIPLPKGGDAFWLDSRTIALVVEENKKQELYALQVTYEKGFVSTGEPILVGSFPVTTTADFRYSARAGVLVFSAHVHADDDLAAVKENDEAYENRGDTALVYDQTFERHWDKWVGPKHKSLFTVKLSKDHGKYVLGDNFVNVLKGTSLVWHVSCWLYFLTDYRVRQLNPLVKQMISTFQIVRSS